MVVARHNKSTGDMLATYAFTDSRLEARRLAVAEQEPPPVTVTQKPELASSQLELASNNWSSSGECLDLHLKQQCRSLALLDGATRDYERRELEDHDERQIPLLLRGQTLGELDDQYTKKPRGWKSCKLLQLDAKQHRDLQDCSSSQQDDVITEDVWRRASKRSLIESLFNNYATARATSHTNQKPRNKSSGNLNSSSLGSAAADEELATATKYKFHDGHDQEADEDTQASQFIQCERGHIGEKALHPEASENEKVEPPKSGGSRRATKLTKTKRDSNSFDLLLCSLLASQMAGNERGASQCSRRQTSRIQGEGRVAADSAQVVHDLTKPSYESEAVAAADCRLSIGQRQHQASAAARLAARSQPSLFPPTEAFDEDDNYAELTCDATTERTRERAESQQAKADSRHKQRLATHNGQVMKSPRARPTSRRTLKHSRFSAASPSGGQEAGVQRACAASDASRGEVASVFVAIATATATGKNNNCEQSQCLPARLEATCDRLDSEQQQQLSLGSFTPAHGNSHEQQRGQNNASQLSLVKSGLGQGAQLTSGLRNSQAPETTADGQDARRRVTAVACQLPHHPQAEFSSRWAGDAANQRAFGTPDSGGVEIDVEAEVGVEVGAKQQQQQQQQQQVQVDNVYARPKSSGDRDLRVDSQRNQVQVLARAAPHGQEAMEPTRNLHKIAPPTSVTGRRLVDTCASSWRQALVMASPVRQFSSHCSGSYKVAAEQAQEFGLGIESQQQVLQQHAHNKPTSQQVHQGHQQQQTVDNPYRAQSSSLQVASLEEEVGERVCRERQHSRLHTHAQAPPSETGPTQSTVTSTSSSRRLSRPGRSPISLQRQTNARLARHRLKIKQQRQEQLANLALRERQQLTTRTCQIGPNPTQSHQQAHEQIEIEILQDFQDEQAQAADRGAGFLRNLIERLSFSGNTKRPASSSTSVALVDFGESSRVQRPRNQSSRAAVELGDGYRVTSSSSGSSGSRASTTRGNQNNNSNSNNSRAPSQRSQPANIMFNGADLMQYHQNGSSGRGGGERGSNNKKTSNSCGSDQSTQESDSLSTCSSTGSSTLSLNKPFCKICHLSSTRNGSDKLISPCKCSGTMQYIHCGCLLKWLEISNRNNDKPICCELCAHEYTWHKRFNYKQMKLPKCSSKDILLHLVFVLALAGMLFCVLAPMFNRSVVKTTNGEGGVGVASVAGGGSSGAPYQEPTRPKLAGGGSSEQPGQAQLAINQNTNNKPSFRSHFNGFSAASSSTSHHQQAPANGGGGRLANDEKFILVCAACFFVSFFIAIYAQTKARDTLYGLIAKFTNMNLTYYITEYNHDETAAAAAAPAGKTEDNNGPQQAECCPSRQNPTSATSHRQSQSFSSRKVSM